jgi:hypothetical protein
MSRQVADMSPGRITSPAFDVKGNLITPLGAAVPIKSLPVQQQKAIARHGTGTIPSYVASASFVQNINHV